jgi:hypothetical protein
MALATALAMAMAPVMALARALVMALAMALVMALVMAMALVTALVMVLVPIPVMAPTRVLARDPDPRLMVMVVALILSTATQRASCPKIHVSIFLQETGLLPICQAVLRSNNYFSFLLLFQSYQCDALGFLLTNVKLLHGNIRSKLILLSTKTFLETNLKQTCCLI